MKGQAIRGRVQLEVEGGGLGGLLLLRGQAGEAGGEAIGNAEVHLVTPKICNQKNCGRQQTRRTLAARDQKKYGVIPGAGRRSSDREASYLQLYTCNFGIEVLDSYP